MVNVRHVAQHYISKQWSVIPIQPDKKLPTGKWGQYAERPPTALEVDANFATGDKNLAIVTGKVSKLCVVDIDNPALYDDYQKRYPTGLVAHTPSGGFHLFYQYDGEDIGNSVSRLASGIDVRCRHGYVLAAPSHVKYEDGREGDYTWLSEGEASPLPNELRERILSDMRLQNDGLIIQTAKEDGHSLWTRILSSGFTAGQHNVEVRDAARYLFRQGMNAETIINTLTQINSADKTPLPASELRATVNSAVKYEHSRLDQKQRQENNKLAFEVHTYNEVFSEYGNYEGRWLINNWIPEDSVLMVSAPPEHYKTWLLLDAAISLAIGKGVAPFLNEPIESDPMPVLVVQQEDFMGQLMARTRTIMRAKTVETKYNAFWYNDSSGFQSADGQNSGRLLVFGSAIYAPIYLHTDSQLSLEDDDSLAGLEAAIIAYGIKFVAIDPFYMLGKVDDYFAGLAKKMARIKEMRDKHHVAFMFAHHNRKSGGTGRDAIFGSQLLNAAIEGGWLIKEEGEGQSKQRIIQRFGKSFPGAQQAYSLSFNIVTDPGDELYQATIELPENAADNTSGNPRKVIDFVGAHPNLTAKDVADGTALAQAAVSAILKGLIERKFVISSTGKTGKGAKYYLPIEIPEGV